MLLQTTYLEFLNFQGLGIKLKIKLRNLQTSNVWTANL
jgi:hypothetical protein